eukprot:3889230-Rhodomonas_salina.1
MSNSFALGPEETGPWQSIGSEKMNLSYTSDLDLAALIGVVYGGNADLVAALACCHSLAVRDAAFNPLLRLQDSWVAPNAAVIGKVRMEEGSSVWFGTTVRGDNELIHIGKNSNIQD